MRSLKWAPMIINWLAGAIRLSGTATPWNLLSPRQRMQALLFSTLVYLIGVAAVLYFRPAAMFRPDGSWKEFGLGAAESTAFPFWLFCIAWALGSYLIGRVVFSSGPGSTAVTAATTVVASRSLSSRFQGEEFETTAGVNPLLPQSVPGDLMPEIPKKVKKALERVEQPPSGLYKLKRGKQRGGGGAYPRYIFVGAQELAAESEDSSSSEGEE